MRIFKKPQPVGRLTEWLTELDRLRAIEAERDRYWDALALLRRRCGTSQTGLISITAVRHVVDHALSEDGRPTEQDYRDSEKLAERFDWP